MRVQLQPAYILHRKPYRNTSYLVELFSKDYGRICAVVRGAQRSRTIPPSTTQPFQRVLASWSGQGEVQTITSLETSGHAPDIQPSFTASAFYLNELIMRLVHRHDPHEYVFIAYENALLSLSACADTWSVQQVLRVFEKRLLEEMGYGLVLGHLPATGEALIGDEIYYYLPDSGPVKNQANQTGGVTLHGHSLLALANETDMSDLQLREIKQLMRLVLRQHLGDKPLQSRLMYNRVL